MNRFLVLVAALGLTLSACDSTGGPDTLPEREVKTASNVVADPATRDNNTGVVTSTGRYTLYSLRDNRVVLNYDNPNRADSATTKWDLGFRGTSIIFNSGTSGPGQAAAFVATGLFDSFTSVPDTTTLRVDGNAADACPGVQTPNGPVPGAPRAICTGSGNGWYTYNQGQNLITPIPGRTILVRTADGRGYAKVKIDSYYKDAPSNPVTTGGPGDTPDRNYTFRYVLNPSGRSFAPAL